MPQSTKTPFAACLANIRLCLLTYRVALCFSFHNVQLIIHNMNNQKMRYTILSLNLGEIRTQDVTRHEHYLVIGTGEYTTRPPQSLTCAFTTFGQSNIRQITRGISRCHIVISLTDSHVLITLNQFPFSTVCLLPVTLFWFYSYQKCHYPPGNAMLGTSNHLLTTGIDDPTL